MYIYLAKKTSLYCMVIFVLCRQSLLCQESIWHKFVQGNFEVVKQIYVKLWWNSVKEFSETFQNLIWWPNMPTSMAKVAKTSLTWHPVGSSLTNLLVGNNFLNWNQTSLEWSLGGSLLESYQMTLPTNQYGCLSLT